MSDVTAIAGSLAKYTTLADGCLRITIDLPETETQHFHELFPAIHAQVALTPLLQATAPERRFGEEAKTLRLSAFMGYMDVWRATGTDDDYLAFVREQKCCARSGAPCGGDIVAAHVRRVSEGAGTGVKPLYCAVALCVTHHDAQHLYGEDAVGGREHVERQRYETVCKWIWATIKRDIGVESMTQAQPAQVFAWAQHRGIERYLPALFRECAS